jgi:choloylglycine hydrolase
LPFFAPFFIFNCPLVILVIFIQLWYTLTLSININGGKMKKGLINFLSGIIFLIVFFNAAQSGEACSTFQLQHGKHLVVGKNFDFHTDIGMVIINKRNVAKTALLSPWENPARWVSKYGSITFNQVGREFPFSGINEAGLIVEIMWLDESQYPE